MSRANSGDTIRARLLVELERVIKEICRIPDDDEVARRNLIACYQLTTWRNQMIGLEWPRHLNDVLAGMRECGFRGI